MEAISKQAKNKVKHCQDQIGFSIHTNCHWLQSRIHRCPYFNPESKEIRYLCVEGRIVTKRKRKVDSKAICFPGAYCKADMNNVAGGRL